jgi:hypothetical protein
MVAVVVEPMTGIPFPYSDEDELPTSYLEQMAIAGNTAELQVELGALLDVDEETAEQEKRLIEAVVKARDRNALQTTNTAFAAAAFLRSYGSSLGLDVASARAAITNKLMEIANCGDTKYELKALELLGKHSDIGLFTDRSEITIRYKDPAELEEAIKERVKRLLNANTIDITPAGLDLDEELGIAEFTPVTPQDPLAALEDEDGDTASPGDENL